MALRKYYKRQKNQYTNLKEKLIDFDKCRVCVSWKRTRADRPGFQAWGVLTVERSPFAAYLRSDKGHLYFINIKEIEFVVLCEDGIR